MIATLSVAALVALAAPAPAQVAPVRGPSDGLLFAGGSTNLTTGVFFPGTATCTKDGCETLGGLPPLQVKKGTDVTFTNLDVSSVTNGHRIVSFDRKKKGKKKGTPLFFSDTSNGPDQTTVKTSKLKPGVYFYLCTTHTAMYGAIEVYDS